MTKAIAQTYGLVHEYRRRIVFGLFAGCLALAGFYVLSVYTVISRTVAIQKIDKEMAAMDSAVDGLDAEYIALSSSLTPESLSKYGMSQGKVAEYISRSSSLSRVAMGGHEL